MMDASQSASEPKGPPPDSVEGDRRGRDGMGGTSASTPAEAANDGVLDSAQALWRDVTAHLKDHIELALLETQRAGKSAVNMLIYAIAAALLLVTAWLGALAALVVGLAACGLHPGWGILIVVGLNLGGVFALYLMIRRNSENLRFPATVRSLKSDAAALRVADRP